MPNLTELAPQPHQDFDWQFAESQFVDSEIDAANVIFHGIEMQLSGRQSWISVDSLPSIHAIREMCDEDSQRLLEERLELLRQGEFEQVPYAFNVLTTAHKVLEAERLHGKDSEEYKKVNSGFTLDIQRHRDEARRRLTYEYFGEVAQPFDAAKDSYVYGDYNFKEIVDNGLTPVGSEGVGIEALIANRREEYTSVAIGKLALEHTDVVIEAPNLTMFTVSQIETSPQTMIWAIRFDPKNNRRFHEQVGFTRDYITHEVVIEAFKRKEVIDQDAQPSTKELLDIQALSTTGDTVLDLMKTLDEIATEQSGVNVFMGEAVDDDFIKDYAGIPAEAEARQAQNEDEITDLRAEVLRLAHDNTDGWHANQLIDNFVTNLLLDKVENDPAAALPIFGKDTVSKLSLALEQRQAGNIQIAEQLLTTARSEAPKATVCNGSSCDLEAVSTLTKEGSDLATKLKAEAGDIIVKDKKRTCKKCNQRTIVYAYNSSHVNKLCTNPKCGVFESKVSKVKVA